MRLDHQQGSAIHAPGLSAQARRAFSGPSALGRAIEQAARARQACREALNSKAAPAFFVSKSTSERHPSQLRAAGDFSHTEHSTSSAADDLTFSERKEGRSHNHSTAAEVFQHFFESEHLRDEEVRLLLRRDRAVGVAAMVFTSLAAEGLGEVRDKPFSFPVLASGWQTSMARLAEVLLAIARSARQGLLLRWTCLSSSK